MHPEKRHNIKQGRPDLVETTQLSFLVVPEVAIEVPASFGLRPVPHFAAKL